MDIGIVRSTSMVALVGGGRSDKSELEPLLMTASHLVAADGGADRLFDWGIQPDAVIGDLDSASPTVLAALPAGCVHHIAEQDSTDFDKCLRNIVAPMVVGVGFLGGRVDHELAVLNVLVRHGHRRCVLVGQDDVIAHIPPALDLPLPEGARVSLFPLLPVQGQSTGLRWPIDGLAMAPGGQTGTSNEATGHVSLRMDGPGMLVLLDSHWRDLLIDALRRAPKDWPDRR
ncbi:thiamine diphosphokinase [Pseudoprimorskyibacter insulae]|uniref:Thiamine diphosphokinase n=1 Tax=Pseudoprimorskyibacter insulae TaxID=1695997 RepID=A0A2R8AYX1_9RHOB|nr:thiamine diphosphokinase [Pseudoprimorskyibacter insulae]SPF81054.1 hypothetical protein PRI8871_02871 [Pseudoprimorskyibacter insulae]